MMPAKSAISTLSSPLRAPISEFDLSVRPPPPVPKISRTARAFLLGLSEFGETIAAVSNAGAEIQKFAYDTQLLALNARIEAAHAGAAGAGFSVIAEGVEMLADNIRAATT
jgi:methyl-accepting chemotaxis protein